LVGASCDIVNKMDKTRKRYRDAIIARNRKVVDDIKVDGFCADCGQWFPPCAMDFDHVRGVKVRTVSQLIPNSSLEKLLLEIDKCELVCACCHRIRTAKRRQL
jgi:hypothetical protein